MTVPTTNNSNTSTGDGTTKIFPFDFALLQKSDLQVYIAGVLQSSGYSISINQNGVGGIVTFTLAPGAGLSVARIRIVDYLQGTELPTEGNMPEKVIENMVDKVTMEIQQIVNRGIGNVAGPTVSVDGAVALFDGTAGNLLKSGPLLPASGQIGDVVGPTSSTDGNLALFDGSTGKAIRQGAASFSIVQGPGSSVDGNVALFQGTAGNLLKQGPMLPASGSLGDVVGPTSSTDGNIGLFNGVTGKLLKQGPAASTIVVGPASAIDGHLAVFDGATGKLVKDGGVVPSGGGGSGFTFAQKPNDTTRSSTTTLTDDPDLVLSVVSGGQYSVEALLIVTASSTTPDLKLTFRLPTPSACRWAYAITGAGWSAQMLLSADPPAVIQLTTAVDFIIITGIINIGTTGTVAIQWAQNASSTSGTVIGGYSYMRLFKFN